MCENAFLGHITVAVNLHLWGFQVVLLHLAALTSF